MAALAEKDAAVAKLEDELHLLSTDKNKKIAEAETKLQSALDEKGVQAANYESQIAELVEEREKIAEEFANLMQFLSYGRILL